MKEIIFGLVGAILSVTGVYSYSQYSQTFGALPLIQSAQLAANPSNGECLTTDGTNNDWTTCASGGGGGGGFWATTTNNLIIYPTSDTYTVSIGANATTTSEFWFDPNTSRSKIPYASTTMITATTASSTSLIVSGLNAASCDVKASTAGVLSCGTDATGGSSDYDAWTHPGSGISATTSQIIISASSTIGDGSVNGGLTVNGTATTSRHIVVRGTATSTIAGNLNIASTKKLVFGAATNEGGSIMNWNEKGAINFLGDASASGKLSFGAYGAGTHASHNFFSLAAENASAGTGAWNGILLNVTQTATPSGTKNLINLQTDSTSQFSVSSAGSASTTALTVSSLNAASCDVKASTAGVLSCGTDATGAGGSTPDSKWATSTDFAIYPSGVTNSLIIGRTNQLGNDCLICSFATSSTGTLIFASSSSPYDADNFHLYSSHNSLDTFYISAGGDMFLRDDATFGGGLTINSLGGGSTLLISGSASTLQVGTAGVTLTDDGDGALTIASFGDTNNEDLTVNLDDTADTAVWSSSTGVNNIDWSAITKSTFTNASSSLFSTTYGSTTDAIIGRSLTLFGTAYTTLASLGNALVNAVTAVTPTGTWDFGGATSVEMVNGSSPTVDAIGEFALDTTANEFLFATSTNAGGAAVIKPYKTIGFTYSTTSWTGTTTILLGPADASQDFKEARCETTTGTVNVSVYDGTNRMDLLNASSTIGVFKFATNNNFTAQEARRVDIGTPASSPVKMACTFTYTYVRN